MATILFQGVRHDHHDGVFPVYTRISGELDLLAEGQELVKLPEEAKWKVKVVPTDQLWPGEKGPIKEVWAIPPCLKHAMRLAEDEGREEEIYEALRATARWEYEEASHSKAKLELAKSSWPMAVQLESARISLRVSTGFEDEFWPVIQHLHPEACLDRGILSLPIGEVQLWHNPKLDATFLDIGGGLLIHTVPVLPFAEDVGLPEDGGVHVHGRENGPYAAAIEFCLTEAKASAAAAQLKVAGMLRTLAGKIARSSPASSDASGGHSGQHG